MDIKEFKQKMKMTFQTIDMDIEDSKIEKFWLYMKLLLEWNEKMNLTSIVNEEEIIIKHFLDSITVLKYINTESTVIDVGTGAGFPGIPINIMMNCKVTLLDSLNKRTHFLKEIENKLHLKNIEIIHARAEELGKNKTYRTHYDVALSRAVAPLNVLLEYVIPFIKINGKFICMKGPNIEEEVKDATKALKILGGEIERIDKIWIGQENMQRNIIVIKKTGDTPNGFPRQPGKATREPIV